MYLEWLCLMDFIKIFNSKTLSWKALYLRKKFCLNCLKILYYLAHFWSMFLLFLKHWLQNICNFRKFIFGFLKAHLMHSHLTRFLLITLVNFLIRQHFVIIKHILNAAAYTSLLLSQSPFQFSGAIHCQVPNWKKVAVVATFIWCVLISIIRAAVPKSASLIKRSKLSIMLSCFISLCNIPF